MNEFGVPGRSLTGLTGSELTSTLGGSGERSGMVSVSVSVSVSEDSDSDDDQSKTEASRGLTSSGVRLPRRWGSKKFTSRVRGSSPKSLW